MCSKVDGHGCTGIGQGANPSGGAGTSYDNTTGLGYTSTCTASDQARIGNSSVNSIGGYASWTTLPSDSRFKTQVAEDVVGLEFIELLRPVSYNVDVKAIDQFLSSNYGTSIDADWPTKFDKEQVSCWIRE